jgi:hypothetical protein
MVIEESGTRMCFTCRGGNAPVGTVLGRNEISPHIHDREYGASGVWEAPAVTPMSRGALTRRAAFHEAIEEKWEGC